MSGPIQSWKDKVAEALTFANEAEPPIHYVLNPKYIVMISLEKKSVDYELRIIMSGGKQVVYWFSFENKEKADIVCQYLDALMTAS